MRIGLVCPYALDIPGGVQDQVFRLSRWLQAAGHETTVVGPGTGAVPGAVVVGSPTTVRANRSKAAVAIRRGVSAAVRDAIADVDVIHIHEPFVPMVSLTATRVADQPTVGTFHADASRPVRGVLRLGGPVTRQLAARLDVKTAVSSVARSAVRALDNVRIVPNGIDVADYEGFAAQSNSVVFLGRDDPRKGLDVLLAAWPRVRAKAPYAELSVIGVDRDEEIEGVTFLGRVTEDDKRRLLGTAAVFVAPNLGGESFGIVVAEAMAAGCAVVASAIPAFAKVLGDAGELVRPGDAAELADRVSALLEDRDRRARMSAAASLRVRRFDGSEVAGSYLQAYVDAIELHGLRR